MSLLKNCDNPSSDLVCWLAQFARIIERLEYEGAA